MGDVVRFDRETPTEANLWVCGVDDCTSVAFALWSDGIVQCAKCNTFHQKLHVVKWEDDDDSDLGA